MEIFSVPFQQGERRSNVIHVKKNQKEKEKKKKQREGKDRDESLRFFVK